MSTRSPTWLSLASSCAFSFFDMRMTRWYFGWRYTRSIRTTRVFCIASLTTTPSRLLRSPTAYPFAFFLAAALGAFDDFRAALGAFGFDALAFVFRDRRSAGSAFAAGVSVTGPAFRVSQEALDGWAASVRETAGAIMDDMRARLGPRA